MKRPMLVLPLVLLVVSSCAYVRPPEPQIPDLARYTTLMVAPFEAQGPRDLSGAELADQIVIELRKMGSPMQMVDASFVGAAARAGASADSVPVVFERGLAPDLVLAGTIMIRMETVARGDSLRQAHASATVKAVDGHTGKIIWADRLSEDAESPLHSFTHVSDAELREEAITGLARKISRLFVGR